MMVKPKLRYYIPQSHNTVTGQAEMVDPEDMSKAMERYVFDEDMRIVHGKLGKELAIKYSWENCTAILFKRLQALEDD